VARDSHSLPDPVLVELLEQHFTSYSRSLTTALPFAAVSALLMRNTIPASLLVAWFVGFCLTIASRYATIHAFRAKPADTRELRLRLKFAVLGHALGGISWGILGTLALHLAPDHPENVGIVFFVVGMFAAFQAANPTRYEPAYFAWLLAAMVPILSAASVNADPRYHTMAIMGTLFLVMITLTGRRASQLMMETIAKRQENARLLADLLAQKEALAEANRAKTRFFAAASHDLRQPMQAVVLLVESLQERVTEPATRRIVESITTSVVAMSALLNELLDISRFDAGTVKVQKSTFPVARLLDRLRNGFSAAARQKGLFFRVRRCSAVIESDPILLYRVMVNLLNNALRYTKSGGVLVGCRQRADGLWIEVWDTGIGIPKESFKDIFREFHQLANPQRDREQGLGLGLAIVERTTRLLDHPIGLRSRVGRGSVFAVRVPYGDPAKVVVAERAQAADDLEGLDVLVVEDERDIRVAMVTLLQGWGCNVVAVDSAAGADIVVADGSFVPDVVLADYRLPDDNGLNVIAKIRACCPDAAAIIISGDIGADVLKEEEASGYHVLHKPMRPARLRALLGSIWRERNAREKAVEARG
jgi:signal transduction histidine kinase/ActR/RegA family two-component response regulator